MIIHQFAAANQIVGGNNALDTASDQMPSLSTKGDRLKYAFHLIAEHGENLGGYVLTRLLHALTPEEMIRWETMSQVIEEILGRPLAILEGTTMRIGADGSPEQDENHYSVTGKKLDRPDDC